MPDAHVNFASSEVVTAPSPATSGTTLTVLPGDGAIFPIAAFNAVVLSPTLTSRASPSPADAEIVRVSIKSTDTFTIQRGIEGSSVRSIVVGDRIIAGTYQGITAQTLTDIEANLQVALDWHVTDVGTVGTAETDLNVGGNPGTVPAGRMVTSGDTIVAFRGGSVTSFTSPNRTWTIYFGGQLVATIQPATAGAVSWNIDVVIMRSGSTQARVMVEWQVGSESRVIYLSLTSVNWAIANDLRITGTGQATNDIVAKIGSIRYAPI